MSHDHHLTRADKVRRRRVRKLAEAALEQYGLQDARIRFLKEGYRPPLLVVSPARGKFVLHMYPLPRSSEDVLRSEDGLRSQLQWQSALRREAQLPVPEPIPNAEGSLTSYVSVEGVPNPRYCVLLRWVPGRHKVDRLKPAHLSLIGSYAARLHRHAEHYSVSEGFMRPRWDWEWLSDESEQLWSKGELVYSTSEMEIFRAAMERIRKDMQALGEGSDVFGIIHRDLHPLNYVFHKRAAYVIDFDVCGWGYYLYDLAVPLVDLDFTQEHYGAPYARMEAAFLEGYQRERPLPMGYQEYIDTFLAMEMMRYVNMILGWKAPTQRPWGPKYLAGVRERLEKFAENDRNPKPVLSRFLLWLKSRSPI